MGATARSLFFEADEIISTYSRAQAVEDGVLVDVSDTMRQVGITTKTALTRTLYEDCVAWTDADSKRQTYQDESGRLWDVLFMCSRVVRSLNRAGDSVLFQVLRVPRGGRDTRPRLVTLKVVLGRDEMDEWTLTVMRTDED
jgi:hypothetical protein